MSIVRQGFAHALILAMAAGPAGAGDAPGGSCGDSLPVVLTVALPFPPDHLDEEGGRLKDAATGLFRTFYHAYGRCRHDKQLQVNIAFGNDYQILDWLSHGLVDAAIATDLTLHFLHRDGVPVRELRVDLDGVREGGALNGLLPLIEPRVLACQSNGSQSCGVQDAWARFDEFRESVWCETMEGIAAGPPEQPAAGACGERRGTGEPERRILLSSHLSTTGFLEPVGATQHWLQQRLKESNWKDQNGEKRNEVMAQFWDVFFRRADFSLEQSMDTGLCEPCGGPMAGSGRVTVVFPGENDLRREISRGAAPPGEPVVSPLHHRVRQHVVVAPAAAERVFVSELPAAAAVEPRLPGPLQDILDPDGTDADTLPAFRPMIEVPSLFGVRTFSFTLEETIRLLRSQQISSGQASLSLVLPGGGVKAAFQARLIEKLYSTGQLRNRYSGPPDGSDPLRVHYVVGTSGGALLGFFVSQLGVRGAEGLPDILFKWADGKWLESHDLFSETDAMRYVSFVVIFAIFCGLLVARILLLRRKRAAVPSAGATGFRLAALLYVGIVLLVTPPLLRFANGVQASEHIPESEGLLYAGFILLAIFIDQCLVFAKGSPGAALRRPVLTLGILGAGLGLVALSLAGNASSGFLSESVTTIEAIVVMGSVIGLMVLILDWLLTQTTWRRSGTLWVAGCVLGIGAGIWLGTLPIPVFIGGLGLFLTLIFAAVHVVTPPGQRWERVRSIALPLAGSAAVLMLCSPRASETAWSGSWLAAPSGLGLIRRPFLLGSGLFLVYLALVLSLLGLHRHYRIRDVRRFLLSLGLGMAHLVTVSVMLFAAAYLLLVPRLELTPRFWIGLVIISVVSGGAILLIAEWRATGTGVRGRAVEGLRSALDHLCSHHPNAGLVTSRFARMGCLAFAGVFWWNLVMAPGLYGNGPALRYLDAVLERFQQKLADDPADPAIHLTTRFIVPTNVLEQDGTRFFLFVPGDTRPEDCPVIARRPASGARWHVRRVAVDPGTAAGGGCAGVPAKDYVKTVIFASGSPFPIFPAHRLEIEGEEKEVVDGGYSSNVPVDAALTVGAEQVLIVHATNPMGHSMAVADGGLRETARRIPGRLFQNLGRIPVFFFERSQQIDRLSRRDLFVVSLAPPAREPGWPALFDFRTDVVERMIRVAEENLSRRIGMVESWGRPRFRLSVLVQPLGPQQSASRATRRDPA